MTRMTRQSLWNPAAGHDPMRQLLTRLFDAAENGTGNDDSSVVTSQWMPLVDIREDADRFVLLADIPGVDPKDIDVQMDKGLLTIKGERAQDPVGEQQRFSRTERVHGVFHRRFALPDSADPERITASGHNGVLEIVIPKKPETTPRKIQVGTTLQS
jgi:HSP20 family protein